MEENKSILFADNGFEENDIFKEFIHKPFMKTLPNL
jgi:hypothetical protein